MSLSATRRQGVSALLVSLGLIVGATAGITGAAYSMSPTPQDQDTAQARGERALAEAREHEAAGRWASAREAYTRALELLPGNQDARAGLDRANRMLNQGSPIQDEAQETQLRRDQAIKEFDASYNAAQQLLSEGQYDEAQRTMLTARLRLNQARQWLSEPEFNQRASRADTLLQRIQDTAAAAEARRRQEEEAAIQRAREDEARREAQARQAQIDEAIRRVRELQQQLKYGEALQVVDQILFLDPHNATALLLRDILQTADLWQSWMNNEREREVSYNYIIEETRAALRAPRPNFGPGPKSTTGIMVYPEDWPQLSIRRTSDGGFVDTDANRAVNFALNERTIPVDFDHDTFAGVIEYMETVTRVNIVPDWKALSLINVTPDDPVSLQLQGEIQPAIVLDRVLEQLGDTFDRPRYAIQDGMVVLTSEDAIRRHVETVVYDIRDLLFEVPYFDNAPPMDLESMLAGQPMRGGLAATVGNDVNANSSGSAGDGGWGNYGSGNIFKKPNETGERKNREDIIEEIVSIIQSTVDTDGWRDLGGDTGTISELQGNLIIRTTPRAHQQIQGLLNQLREVRALQINIESRFLTVDMNWFEKIGFDLDLYFNTNNTMFQQARGVDPNFQQGDFFDQRGRLKDPLIFDGFIPSQLDANGNPISNTIATGNTFGVPDAAGTGITYLVGPTGAPIRNRQGFAPIGISQDSFNLVDVLGNFDADSFAGEILNFNPAVSIGIQFLDDVQVDLLIEATQADKRSVLLTAPRLTLFNGQRAWVLVGTQTAFVSALIPIVGDASGAFQPILGVLNDGVTLDVEAVISADRRYVTMTVITGVREIIDIEQLEFQGAAGGGGVGGGQAAIFSGIVNLPEVEVALINTTVSVPDRGTVLLGGQRIVEEVEVETGVPILSKIPFINRFFTNRVTSKAESTLLILIRPEVIIQQENEDILFPGLSDTLGGSGSYRF